MKRLLLFLCAFLIIFSFTKAQQLPPQYNSSPEAKEKAKNQLKEIRERIKTPEDFYKQALLYSDDPGSNRNGGCYDSLKRGVFIPEFEKVAFSMKVGEISDIFETKFGFHIILLRARRDEEIDVCHILIIPKF